MLGTLFQFRIAFKTSAFVRFFCGAARCTRLSTNSGPFRSHTNTSPGAAPGSTTRFLLSAVNVMVGLSHVSVHAVKARSRITCSRISQLIPGSLWRQIWQLCCAEGAVTLRVRHRTDSPWRTWGNPESFRGLKARFTKNYLTHRRSFGKRMELTLTFHLRRTLRRDKRGEA